MMGEGDEEVVFRVSPSLQVFVEDEKVGQAGGEVVDLRALVELGSRRMQAASGIGRRPRPRGRVRAAKVRGSSRVDRVR